MTVKSMLKSMQKSIRVIWAQQARFSWPRVAAPGMGPHLPRGASAPATTVIVLALCCGGVVSGQDAVAEVPVDQAPADQVPTDQVPADQVPADQAPADQAPADQVPADQVPADQAQVPLDQEPVQTQTTRFAPGVVNVVAPAPHPEETFSGPMTLQSLIDAHPEIRWGDPDFADGRPYFDPRTRTLIEMARQVTLRREIYCLEFAFKPLRMIYLDVPQPNGQMARKLIWYMVYRVRYRGGDLRPAADLVGNAPLFKRVESVSYDSRRAFPMLVLEDHVNDEQYLDRVLPTAKERIAVREQITAPLYDSIEIPGVEIPRSSDEDSPGVWGVATWEDVDPDIDFLSVYVHGLTNAFKQEGEGDEAPYQKKALRLNFYRPGDRINQREDRIRFGVPAYQDPAEQEYVLDQYGLDSRLDYEWVFR